MGDPFQPTWPRALFALAVATLGFLLPQEVPLEYYPLSRRRAVALVVLHPRSRR